MKIFELIVVFNLFLHMKYFEIILRYFVSTQTFLYILYSTHSGITLFISFEISIIKIHGLAAGQEANVILEIYELIKSITGTVGKGLYNSCLQYVIAHRRA